MIQFKANPNCNQCKGSGTAYFVVSSDGDVIKDACACIKEVEK